MDRVLTKIQSTNPELNRIQDRLLQVLNPVLKRALLVAERYTTATRPPASSALAGTFIRVRDGLTDEVLQVCLQDDTGAWVWSALEPGQLGGQWTAIGRVTVGNTTAETTMLTDNAVGSLTFPAGFWTPGRMVAFCIKGYLSSGSAQTSTFRVKLGGTTLVTSSGTLPNGLSQNYVEAHGHLLCVTGGSAGQINFYGRTILTVSTGITSAVTRPLYNLTPVTVDLSGPTTFDATYQWATALASNTVTLVEGCLDTPGIGGGAGTVGPQGPTGPAAAVHAVSVKTSADTSESASGSAVPFDSADVDVFSWLSGGTVVCGTAAYYTAHTEATVEGLDTGDWVQLEFTVGGASVYKGPKFYGGNVCGVSAETVLDLAEGSVVGVNVYHSGTTCTVKAGANLMLTEINLAR